MRQPASLSNQQLRERLRALREALAAAPPRRAASIRAHAGRVNAVALTPDGRSALTGGDDRAVRLWDLRSGFELREVARMGGPVRAVAVSPNGRLLAACAPEGVGVWDAEAGREMRRFESDAALSSLCFTPDGKRLLIGGTSFLRVWELDSSEMLAMIDVAGGPASGEAVCCVASSPDGRRALCGCAGSADARLIDLESGECVRRFAGYRGWVRLFRPATVSGVAFSADGKRALTGSTDQTARVWDIDSGEQVTRFVGHGGVLGWRGVVGVLFRPGGRRALSAGEDGSVRLWDVEGGKQRDRYDHGGRVCCLAMSRDGRVTLSGGEDGFVRVWELPG